MEGRERRTEVWKGEATAYDCTFPFGGSIPVIADYTLR